jgi:AAA+ superfamily predicted ATPase
MILSLILGILGIPIAWNELIGLAWFVIWFCVLTFIWVQGGDESWRIDQWMSPSIPSTASGFSAGLINITKFVAVYTISYPMAGFLMSGAESIWTEGGVVIEAVVVLFVVIVSLTTNLNESSRIWNPFHVGVLTSLIALSAFLGGLYAGIYSLPVIGNLTHERILQLSFYPGGVMWLIAAYPPEFLQRSQTAEAVQDKERVPASAGVETSSARPDSSPTRTTESTQGTQSPQMHDGGFENPHPDESTATHEQNTQMISENLEFDWQEPPQTTFDDVGGYESVKEELREDVVSPYVNDSAGYDRFGVTPDQGVLFHGPPGTGKTLFARALANALQRPYVELSQSQLTSKWINEGPDLVNRLFEEAQQLEGVVFIDEAESLLGSRDDGLSTNREDAKTTNTFLNKLSQDDQQFFVVLTTNRKEQMDEAVLRPGRIDKHVEIPLPNSEARFQILRTQLEDVPTALRDSELREMVEELEAVSGADLEQLVADARRSAAKENAEALKREHFDLSVLNL